MIKVYRDFSKNKKFDMRMKEEVNLRLLELVKYFLPIRPAAEWEIIREVEDFFPYFFEETQIVHEYLGLVDALSDREYVEISDVKKYVLFHVIQKCINEVDEEEDGINLDHLNSYFIDGIELYDRFEYLEYLPSFYDLVFDSYDFLKKSYRSPDVKKPVLDE